MNPTPNRQMYTNPPNGRVSVHLGAGRTSRRAGCPPVGGTDATHGAPLAEGEVQPNSASLRVSHDVGNRLLRDAQQLDLTQIREASRASGRGQGHADGGSGDEPARRAFDRADEVPFRECGRPDVPHGLARVATRLFGQLHDAPQGLGSRIG